MRQLTHMTRLALAPMTHLTRLTAHKQKWFDYFEAFFVRIEGAIIVSSYFQTSNSQLFAQ